ncbi:MAG: hypothetical protein AAFW75_15775 [Cyanobacteria bacterium J06636_16]
MQKANASYPFLPILGAVLFLTLFSAGASFWLSSQEQLSPQQDRIFNISAMTWQMGTITVFSLLGGKAAGMIKSDHDK